MMPLRVFGSRACAFGNVTTRLMMGAICAAGFLVTEVFQLAPRPLTGLGRRTPGALLRHADGHLTDRRRCLRPHRPRPVMATGLFLLTAGLAWATVRGSMVASWVELDIALLVAGVGISMARCRRCPTAVLERRRTTRAGQSISNQRHDAAPRARRRDRRRRCRVRRLQAPRRVRARHRRLQVSARRLRRPRVLAALSAPAITSPKTQHARALAEGGLLARPQPATAVADRL